MPEREAPEGWCCYTQWNTFGRSHEAGCVGPRPTGTVDPNREVPEDEVKALVVIEASERLVNRALREIRTKTNPDMDWVELLLTEAADITTSRTCTAVKSLALSEKISLDADLVVDRHVKSARAEQARQQERG